MYSTSLDCYFYVIDPMVKIFRDSNLVLADSGPQSADICTARNEYEYIQIVLAAGKRLKNVKVEFTDLRGPGGNRIKKENLQYNFIGYLSVRHNTFHLYANEILHSAPADFPEILLSDRTCEISPQDIQPIWLTLFTPPNTLSGIYKGQAVVTTSLGDENININVRVWNFAVSEKQHVDNVQWFGLDTLCTHHQVKIWSPEYFTVLKNYAVNMKAHRMNIMWIPMFNGGVPEMQLVQITKAANGEYCYNFNRLDQMVDTFEPIGFDKYLLSHVAGRDEWEGRNFYLTVVQYDEKTGKFETCNRMPWESDLYRKIMGGYLKALQKHLRSKNLLRKTLMHVSDEPLVANRDVFIEMCSWVRNQAPEIMLIEAIRCEGLKDAIDIQCPELDEWSDYYIQCRKKGKKVYWYTCGLPEQEYPNRFLDQALIKPRIIGWLTWKYGVSGHLHWGYNFWTKNPWYDPGMILERVWSETYNLPPGDSCVVYPEGHGVLNSVRWEMIRKGWEDYEYLFLLNSQITEISNNDNLKKQFETILAKVVRTTTDYTRQNTVLQQCRKEIGEMIEKFAKKPKTNKHITLANNR